MHVDGRAGVGALRILACPHAAHEVGQDRGELGAPSSVRRLRGRWVESFIVGGLIHGAFLREVTEETQGVRRNWLLGSWELKPKVGEIGNQNLGHTKGGGEGLEDPKAKQVH